jgi:hypothetical protein
VRRLSVPNIYDKWCQWLLVWAILSGSWCGYHVAQSWDYLHVLFGYSPHGLVTIQTELPNDPHENPSYFSANQYEPLFTRIVPTGRYIKAEKLRNTRRWFPSFSDKSDDAFEQHLRILIQHAIQRDRAQFTFLAVESLKKVLPIAILPPIFFLILGAGAFLIIRRERASNKL